MLFKFGQEPISLDEQFYRLLHGVFLDSNIYTKLLMLFYNTLYALVLYIGPNVSHVSDLERGAILCRWICYGSSSMCCAKAICNLVSNIRGFRIGHV